MLASAVVLFFNHLSQPTPPHYPFVFANDDLKLIARWNHTRCLQCTLHCIDNGISADVSAAAASGLFVGLLCIDAGAGYKLLPLYRLGSDLEAIAVPKFAQTCSANNKPEYWKSETFNLDSVVPSDRRTDTVFIMYVWFQHWGFISIHKAFRIMFRLKAWYMGSRTLLANQGFISSMNTFVTQRVPALHRRFPTYVLRPWMGDVKFLLHCFVVVLVVIMNS